MIKLTLKEVLEGQDGIQRVMATKLPIKVAYRLSRIAAKIKPAVDAYEEQRTKLVKEHGEPLKGQPNAIQVSDPAKLEIFNREIKELLGCEHEINLDPVKLEDIPASAEIAAADLLACEKFIVE